MRLLPPSLPTAQFEALVQIAADAIISIDDRHHIVLFNHGAEAIFGYDAAEVLGQPLNMILPERVQSEHNEHVNVFARSGVKARLMSERRPVEGRRKNGEEFPAEVSISQVKVGDQSFFTAIVRDISERQRLEAERQASLSNERAARLLAESARRRAAFLARASDLLARSLGYDETLEAVARLCVPELAAVCIIDLRDDVGHIQRFVHCHDSAGGAEVAAGLRKYPIDPNEPYLTRSAMETGEPILQSSVTDRELRAISQDADHLALWQRVGATSFVTAPLLARQRVLGAIGLVTTSARRRFNLDDLAMVTALTSRVALAVDNARLYASATRATALRDEALGMISHDLRNPVASMSIVMSRLEAEPEPSPARRVELLRIGRQSTELMERMIQDLLDMASIDAGKLSVELAPMEVGGVLAMVHEAFVERFAERDVELLVHTPPTLPKVEADAERLHQLIGNLLSNALKFSPSGERVVIKAEQAGTEVVVSVTDRGPGIPSDHLPHVFDRFWQARRSARQRGNGLGLSIAKGIAAAHEGRLWVESVEGGGSTFFLALPALTVAAPDASSSVIGDPSSRRALG